MQTVSKKLDGMKTWGIVCTLLSGALFAVLLGSMHSCGDTYEVDAQGRLLKVDVVDASKNPPSVRRTPVAWAETPKLQPVERWVQPGDRIESTRISAGLWFELTMSKLEVFRGDDAVMLVREGHFFFWGMILGISLFPLICWGIGALWLANLSPRRPRDSEA